MLTTTPTQSPLSLPLELIEACDENNAIIGPTENTGIPWSLHIVCADDAEANRVGNALVETLNSIAQARTKAGEPVAEADLPGICERGERGDKLSDPEQAAWTGYGIGFRDGHKLAAPASPTAGGSDLSETGWFRELEDHLDCAGGLREDDEFSTVTVGLIRLALDALAAQQARIRELEELVSRHDKQDAARRKALNSQLVHIRQLKKALKPFAAVANINAQLATNWPDSKPNSEFCPRLWPDWGDFKLAAALSSQTAAEGDGSGERRG